MRFSRCSSSSGEPGGLRSWAVPHCSSKQTTLQLKKTHQKKEVCGQPTAETRARTRCGSKSRWKGAPADPG
jgi:hypothetical protein